MTRSNPLRPLGIAALALGLVLSACASDDSSRPAATGVESTDAVSTPTDPSTSAPPDTADSTPDDTAGATPDDTAVTEPPATTDAPVVVPAALQFTAPLVGGGEFDGATVADKPTVFWFWAPT